MVVWSSDNTVSKVQVPSPKSFQVLTLDLTFGLDFGLDFGLGLGLSLDNKKVNFKFYHLLPQFEIVVRAKVSSCIMDVRFPSISCSVVFI